MHELRDLSSVIGLLTWDQETMMPPRAAESRAEQLSTLQSMYHQRFSEPRLEELLNTLTGADLPEEQRAAVRNMSTERRRAVKIPLRLVKELAQAQSLAVEAWKEARKNRDFKSFEPHVARLLRLRQEQADAWGHTGERYDALLETYEPGMKTARLEPLFEKLRAQLVPLVKAIAARPPPDRAFITGNTWSGDAQWAFSLELLKGMTFDMDAGRQDRSAHPFSSGANIHDVRLTTRIHEDNPFSAFFSTLHEGGHGLYEQGFAPKLHRTWATGAASMGLHESQSRLWENLVGRSLPFWQHWTPKLRTHFPKVMEGVSPEKVYAAVNHVEPSLIRVEADEVTYNLHILLRFNLELALMRGKLSTRDLPEAWNERMRQDLGITPPHDGDGVLQDIHWSWGEFGYFPTYTLGNLYSASILRSAEKALPSLWQNVRQGEMKPLREWLRTEIHQHGFVYYAEDLVKRATGAELSVEPFIDYLWQKYGPLYNVSRA
jgi:carboxypeptidase Taq